MKTYLLAGAAGLAILAGQGLVTAAQAKTEIPEAANYAELLDPVPDAADRLAADDAKRLRDSGMQLAQVYIEVPQPYGYPPPPYYHHHHHHHWGWGPGYPPPPYYHHHHHHHHYHHHHHHHHYGY